MRYVPWHGEAVAGEQSQDPTAALRALLDEQGVGGAYPEAAAAEVSRWQAESGIDDDTLDDRRGLPFVTVDGPGTRDLDQALLVEPRGSGFGVQYAIADASWFVPADSALFAESLRRGASYYMPGESVPMLPRALSEDLVSLGPGVDRRAMVFDMTVDADGRCTKTEIVRARIRSRHQLTFDHVEALLAGRDAHPVTDADVAESLRCMRAVGELRTRNAEARGVVAYHRTEVKVRLSEGHNARLSAVEVARNYVEADNAQLSLLCNAEGARFLRDRAGEYTHPIYKVHPPPDDDALAHLESRIAAVADAHRLPDVWRWDRAETSLASYVRGLPHDAVQSRVLAAISRQTIMVNVRSAFAGTPARHHGVGADVYGRFSAPMREVVGIFLHKEMWETIANGGPGHVPGRDDALRQRVIEAANRAKQLQGKLTRAADQLVIDDLFAADVVQPLSVRRSHPGTLMGIRRGRVYVRLDTPPLDVKVYVDRLRRDYAPDASGATLLRAGRRLARLGDAVAIRVIARDGDGRWVPDFVD